MIKYRPLDDSRNEIRVLRMHATADPSAVLECTLEHVSLDDYTEPYSKFLELDGAKLTPLHRAIAWTFVRDPTNNELLRKQPEGSVLHKVFEEFSNDPIYLQPTFNMASTYRWGDFVALSYEWGDASQTAEIVVDGERTVVGKNLKDSLWRLREFWEDPDDFNVCLWVDALCINQNDLIEKAKHVKKMGHLYGQADTVVIMASGDVDDPQATKTLFHEVENSLLAGTFNLQKSREILDTASPSAWKGVWDIAGSSYWHRLWIIQEVLLANTGAIVCFGQQHCLLTTFFETLSIIFGNIMHVLANVLSEDEPGLDTRLDALNRLEDFLIIERSKRMRREVPKMMHLLHLGRDARQFDARDKIYGLLDMFPQQVKQAVNPDYSIPVEEVYKTFVIDVIKSTGKLDIVFQRSAERLPDTTLPSWVPDWSAPTTEDKSESLATAFEGAQASGNSHHVFKEPVSGEQMSCIGFQIDSIQQLACSVPHDEGEGEEEAEHDDHNVVLSSVEPPQVYPDSAAVREAFWNAVSLNRYIIRGRSHREDAMWAFLVDLPFFDGRGSRISFFHVIDRFQRCNRDLLIAGKPLPSHFPAWSERFGDLPGDVEIENTLVSLMVTMNFRRFIVTENGYTGMVPRRAQQGDGIFILKGCSVPLVLRPNGDGTYHLVGECYRDRAMNGEAMEELLNGNYKESEIVLR